MRAGLSRSVVCARVAVVAGVVVSSAVGRTCRHGRGRYPWLLEAKSRK
jgi:hypothetical protein